MNTNESSILPGLIPRPAMVREQLAQNLKEAGILRRQLRLSVDAAEEAPWLLASVAGPGSKVAGPAQPANAQPLGIAEAG